MRTLLLAALLSAPVLAQPAEKPQTPGQPKPAPQEPKEHIPVQPVLPTPKAGDITPEAQAVFDRAIAAYKGLKNYQETAVATLRQRATGLPPKSEPPADQASATRFVWAGPDRYSFDTRDIALFRDGKTATVFVKVLGEYTQREPNDQDQRVFANMVEMNPVYQVLAGAKSGDAIGRFATVTKVEPAEVRGVKGKRLTGQGLPPLPGFEILSPTTMFFADDTGLLVQASWDLKAVMQSQIDRSMQPGSPRIVLEQFELTSDRTDIKTDQDAAVVDALLTFKPAPGWVKVADFNMADGKESAQARLLNTTAPDFEGVTLAGKPVALKDFKGKPVLLQFWTASNRQSADALLVYSTMNAEYAPKGVAFLGVNLDHSSVAEQSRRIAAARSANFPQLLDPDKAVGNAYRVAVTPCIVLIDKEGVIRSISHAWDAAAQVEVAGKLDKLLRGEALTEEPKPAPFTPPGHLPASPPAAPTSPAAPAAPVKP